MGEEVDAQEFTGADRTRHREKVRRCLDVFARMLGEAAAANVDFVKARAVVGLPDAAKHTVGAVADFSGRPLESKNLFHSAKIQRSIAMMVWFQA